jgi:hypothetical protein
MKKLIVLIILAVSSLATYAQSCTQPCPPTCTQPCPPSCTQPCAKTCDKTACGPEGTKKEAAVITTMRSDLQTVIAKVSKSSLAFDNQLKETKIERGASDEESLLYISQVAASIRQEFLTKVASAKLVTPLKDYTPSPSSTEQQMVANLKKEIQLLATQAEKL